MTWITVEEARMMDEEMHTRYLKWKQDNCRHREDFPGYYEHKRTAGDVLCGAMVLGALAFIPIAVYLLVRK